MSNEEDTDLSLIPLPEINEQYLSSIQLEEGPEAGRHGKFYRVKGDDRIGVKVGRPSDIEREVDTLKRFGGKDRLLPECYGPLGQDRYVVERIDGSTLTQARDLGKKVPRATKELALRQLEEDAKQGLTNVDLLNADNVLLDRRSGRIRLVDPRGITSPEERGANNVVVKIIVNRFRKLLDLYLMDE